MLILGSSGVYAVQMDEPAVLPLDLAAADPGAWAPGSRADRAIRFRIRLQGPGSDARLAVLTTPAEALAGIECPQETRSSVPVPRGAGVCVVGALPARGGTVDVLLAVPERPQDVTVTAMARMSGPGGETVRQQAQSTIRSTDAAMRPDRGVVGGPETLEHARAAREDRSAGARGVGAPGAASMVLRVPQATEDAEGAPLAAPGGPEAESAPQVAPDAREGAEGTPLAAPETPEAVAARRAERRTSEFLSDLLGKAFVAPAPRSGAAGTETGGTAALPGPAASALPAGPGAPPRAGAPVNPPARALPGGAGATGGPAASHETRVTSPGGHQEAGSSVAAPAPARVPGVAAAPGRPAGPGAPGFPPEGTSLPEGARLSDGAATPGVVPGAGVGMPGQGQVAVPPAGVPAAPALQGQNGRNHSAVGSQAGRKAAGRKARGQRQAAGRSGARGQGAGRSALRHAGVGQPGVGQPGMGLPGIGQPGVGQPMTGLPGMPGVPQPGVNLQALGPVQPGGGRKIVGRPGARRPVVGPMVPGYPGAGKRSVGQPAVPGQGMGRPMIQGYPGIGAMAPGMGQPGVPPRGVGGPMGGPLPPGHPGAGYPAVGPQPGGPQMPVPGGAQMPNAQPGVPGAQPGAGAPGAPGPMMPPVSMGMAGAGQMPGLANGLQLPQAGAFPAAQVPLPQDPRPQGAPLPQDLDGSSGQVQPVAESSPLLTGVRGLPAVVAAVGALLGLLWLQRRIQRRRRSRHVL